MQFEKIFVIGFNKTATSTFHFLFLKNGLSSQHDGEQWDVSSFQCFSDNGNLMNWQDYAEKWPKSVFVLNVRPLEGWMRSRAMHCYTEKLRWGYPPRKMVFSRWIEERNQHYQAVIRFFSDQPERLILVDISRPGWLKFVSEKLGLKPEEFRSNEAKKEIPASFVHEVDQFMNDTFDDMKVSISERSTNFLVESLIPEEERIEAKSLLGLYAHNLELP